MLQVFDGRCAKAENVCAFCWHHKKGLTVKQLKKRKCLARQCGALERKDHPYWAARERIKELKKSRKEKANAKA